MSIKNLILKINRIFFNRFILHFKNTFVRMKLRYGGFFQTSKSLPKISIIREFYSPPYGGGNQYMIYLVKEFRKMGFDVAINSFSKKIKVLIIDYCWFNPKYESLIQKHKSKYASKVIHRIDGLLTEYSTKKRLELDKLAMRINKISDLTIVQSNYSKSQFADNNLKLSNTRIIYNSVDPSIFYPLYKKKLDKNKVIRIVSASWSTNKNKGMDDYKWLDENIHAKVSQKIGYSFVGRLDFSPKNINLISPKGQKRLSNIFQNSDIFIFCSMKDPCPNVLLEAIACGLPVIFKNAGGPKELVKKFGLSYENIEELPGLISEMINNYDYYQSELDKHVLHNAPKDYADELLKLLS